MDVTFSTSPYWLLARLRRHRRHFRLRPAADLGALAINTAGNREETVNYMVNGITLNDLVYSSILFQPSISTVQEFKIDNSTLSAEYGQSSGAVVNVATRSGTSPNSTGSSLNFCAMTRSMPATSSPLIPASRRPSSATSSAPSAGGPIIRGKTFFFIFVRRPSPGAGSGPQQRGSQRCGAKIAGQLQDCEARRVGPAAECRRFRRDAPLHRLGAISQSKRSVGDGRQS